MIIQAKSPISQSRIQPDPTDCRIREPPPQPSPFPKNTEVGSSYSQTLNACSDETRSEENLRRRRQSARSPSCTTKSCLSRNHGLRAPPQLPDRGDSCIVNGQQATSPKKEQREELATQ